MKIPRLFIIFCVSFLSLIYTNKGFCGLVLTDGESYTFEFTSLPYGSEYMEEYFIYALIRVSSTTPDTPQFMFSVYEDSLGQSPIKSSLSSVDPEFGVQSIGYFDRPESSPWQDLQGVFCIDVIEGTIEIESITAAAIINDVLYQQVFPVPISSSCSILLSGILVIVLIRCKRNKSDYNKSIPC